VGEGNQGAFVAFAGTMWVGQAVFLRLGLAYLAEEGEGVLDVLLLRPAQGWAHPVVLLNLAVQAACICFNTFLCVRAFYGIACELTSNEMANLYRYTYLQDASGAYANPFDAGLVRNTLRFFGGGLTDWDAMAKIQRPAPVCSAATFFRMLEPVTRSCGWRRRRQSHGHSHGGQPCRGHHGPGKEDAGAVV